MISAWRMTETIAYDPGYGPLVQTRVRIATWNLWGRYGPWEARLPVIVENLGAINADILALQEVWEDDTRSQARRARRRSSAAPSPCSRPTSSATARARATRCCRAGRSPATRCASLPRARRARRGRRRGRGAAVRVRRGRRAARPDPDVLRAPQLVRRPQRDPSGAGRRDLPLRPRDAAPAVPGGAVRRPQRRPDERRDPHAHRPRRVARAPCRVPRRVGGGRQRASRATRGRTTTRSRRPASTSTAASTT